MVKNLNQADIYLPEVNSRNARKMYKICSKLTIKTCGVFIVNFKQISNIFLMFPSLTLHKKRLECNRFTLPRMLWLDLDLAELERKSFVEYKTRI